MQKILFYLLLCLCVTSCSQNFLYEKDISFPQNVWTYDNKAVFSFEIKNPDKLHNLYLDVAHGIDFQSQNMYVKFLTEYPSGKILSDVISLELAGKNGAWFGNCGSEFCNLRIPIQTNAYFDEAGVHTLTVEQYTRTEDLKNMKHLGFRVEETDKTRK